MAAGAQALDVEAGLEHRSRGHQALLRQQVLPLHCLTAEREDLVQNLNGAPIQLDAVGRLRGVKNGRRAVDPPLERRACCVRSQG